MFLVFLPEKKWQNDFAIVLTQYGQYNLPTTDYGLVSVQKISVLVNR